PRRPRLAQVPRRRQVPPRQRGHRRRDGMAGLPRPAGAGGVTVGWRRKRFEANDGHVGTYICVSAKRTYPTRAAAEEALAEVSQRPPRGEIPVRAYRCDLCPFWHLTSKPL